MQCFRGATPKAPSKLRRRREDLKTGIRFAKVFQPTIILTQFIYLAGSTSVLNKENIEGSLEG